ncbi:MAG: hypothetical protein JXQ29_03245 [Planctomycetes bacterium]|nr:hypothetical protein [Planctomycetota bacterium]
MAIRMILITLLLGALAPTAPAGEDDPPAAADDAGKKAARGTGSIILPDFNPKKQFQVIQQGLEKSIPLGKTLKEAQARLGPMIEKLHSNPDLETEAAVENELAAFVDRLSLQVVDLIGERDRILWAFRDLGHGITAMRSSIRTYLVDLERRIAGERAKTTRLEGELRKLAARVRQAEGAERLRLGRELAVLDRKHQLLASAMTHYEKLGRSFGASGAGLNNIEAAFGRMAQNVSHLLDVLDVQYEILRFSAGTRRDFSRIKEMFARVMGGSEADLKKIVERLRDVNGQIGFLGDFMQTVGEINSFSKLVIDVDTATSEILDVGGTDPEKAGASIDNLLEKWK